MVNIINLTAFSIFIFSPNVTEYVSYKEFIEKFGEEGFNLIRQAERNHTQNHSIKPEENSLIVTGDITQSMYKDILNHVIKSDIKRIIITSPGGDIDAGISIGYLIYKQKLDIEIIDYCISSCANYLFTAAINKTIRDGAAVIWHGNTQQKDFREFDLCGRTVSSLDGLPIDDEEIAELSSPEGQHEWRTRQKREHDFYELIGVNDYIARVGQEPKNYGDFTMPVKYMQQFGVTNIYAPKNYAEVDYCESFNKLNPGIALSCISVSETHFEYENDRKMFGERCAHDGTLIINKNSDDLPI